MMELDAYEPSPFWYVHNPFGIHGIGHAARVLVWAEQISSQLIREGVDVDKEVVRWSAALHDVRRVNDWQDLEHGKRAAAWIQDVGRRLIDLNLDEQQIQKLAYCCYWHVTDDSEIPDMSPELMCLKDADGLDRVRIYDLDPSFLRTAYAKTLCHAAQTLFDVTKESIYAEDAWASVRTHALQMGLWV